MKNVEDVIELLESIKNWTDEVSDERPFGTMDYMQIDSAIGVLRGLTQRPPDSPLACAYCGAFGPHNCPDPACQPQSASG